MATGWEYMTFTYRIGPNNQAVKDQLNNLGVQDWDLIQVVVDQRNDHVAILRRRIPVGKATEKESKS